MRARWRSVVGPVVLCVLAATLTTGAPAVPGAAAPAVQPLPVGATADYQIGGAYEPDADVDVVVRDRGDAPDPERYSVCYVNAFQTQPGSLSWWKKHHPQLLLRTARNHAVRDPGWPDEILLDLRGDSRRKELEKVVSTWFAGCAKAGYEAVEPDNLDSFTRSRGLLTKAQAEAMAKRLVKAAHRHGLAIAQKNTAEIDGRRIGFDFVVAEECEVYRECGTYLKRHPGRVVEVEYTDNGRKAFARACEARAGTHPIVLRDRDVLPRGARNHVHRHC